MRRSGREATGSGTHAAPGATSGSRARRAADGLAATAVARLLDELAGGSGPALAPETGAGSDGATLRERAARIAWSCLVEPGDRIAGALIRDLGAEQALRSLDGGPSRRDSGGSSFDLDAGGCGISAAELEEALARWRPRLDTGRIVRLAEGAAHVGAQFLVPGDPAWPSALNDLGDHAPSGLWVRGDVSLLQCAGAALVGSRAATPYGEGAAVELAAGLGERRLATFSGGAYGIDGAAHRAALAVGSATIAVMAGGPDRLYPSGHRELLERIIAEGALVAELPIGQAPTRWRFLQRNRLVAALSGATIVVEAGARSGAMNTASHAASLGRPLGAVPGPVHSASSAGCHRLIREAGAELIRGVDDALELLGELEMLPGFGGDRPNVAVPADPDPAAEGAARAAPDPDPARRRIRDALARGRPVALDELAAGTGLAASETSAVLVDLELDGVVERVESGWRLASRSQRR